MIDYFDESRMLDGLEQRNKTISIARAISVGSMQEVPVRIADMFDATDKNRDTLDIINELLLMIVIFIKETTLRIAESCTLDEITRYLCSSARAKNIIGDNTVDFSTFAAYAIVDVLQNGGKLLEFSYYGDDGWITENFRLIDEAKGRYSLTLDAMDYLFRQTDIDAVFGYTANTMLATMFLKSGNLNHAVRQTDDLLRSAKMLGLKLKTWELRAKEDVSKTKVSEWRDQTEVVFKTFEDNNKAIKELKENAQRMEDAVRTSNESNEEGRREAAKNVKYLQKIIDNVSAVLDYQAQLLNYHIKLRQLYSSLLEEGLTLITYSHLSLRKDIYEPLLHSDGDFIGMFEKIFSALTLPAIPHCFTPDDVYAEQAIIGDDIVVEESGFDITEIIDEEKELLVAAKDARNRQMIQDLLTYAEKHSQFKLSDLVGTMSQDRLELYVTDNAIGNMFLELYYKGHIDVEKLVSELWVGADSAEGEYDIPFHIKDILGNESNIGAIDVLSSPDVIEFETQSVRCRITDFYFDVTAPLSGMKGSDSV